MGGNEEDYGKISNKKFLRFRKIDYICYIS